MESIELNPDRSSLVVPKEGYILMIRLRMPNRTAYETLFCDYGTFVGRTLRMVGCRCKTFLVGQLPCDYAVQVGEQDIDLNHIIDAFQLPTPPWYYRLGEDAAGLTEADHLVQEVGVLDVFAEMTGAKP